MLELMFERKNSQGHYEEDKQKEVKEGQNE